MDHPGKILQRIIIPCIDTGEIPGVRVCLAELHVMVDQKRHFVEREKLSGDSVSIQRKTVRFFGWNDHHVSSDQSKS